MANFKGCVSYFLGLFFLGSVASLWAGGISLPNCGTATLAQYDTSFTSPSNGCFIGILDYYAFAYKPVTNAPLAGDIKVSVNSTSDGFAFSRVDGTPFTAPAGTTVTFEIDYSILIDPAPIISGGKLALDPPFGNVKVTEDFCNDSIFFSFQIGCVGGPTNTLQVGTIAPLTLSASTSFNNPALAFQTIGLLFTLDGTNGRSGFDSLDNGSTVVLVGAPEPGSITLLFTGLAAAGYKLRKRRSSV
jgi:hypothetical protein